MVGRTGEQNVPRLEVCILARIFPNFDVRNVCLLSSTGCISFVEYRGYDSFPNGIAVRHPRRSEVMSSECQGYNRQQTTAARDNSKETRPGPEQSSLPLHSVAPDTFPLSIPPHSLQRQEPI